LAGATPATRRRTSSSDRQPSVISLAATLQRIFQTQLPHELEFATDGLLYMAVAVLLLGLGGGQANGQIYPDPKMTKLFENRLEAWRNPTRESS